MTDIACPTCTDYVLDQDGACARCGRTTFNTQGKAVMALGGGHVSRSGVVTAVSDGAILGYVEKVPGRGRGAAVRWVIRPYVDPFAGLDVPFTDSSNS